MLTLIVRYTAAVVLMGTKARSSIAIATIGAICTRIAINELIYDQEGESRVEQVIEYIIIILVIFVATTAFWITIRYTTKL